MYAELSDQDCKGTEKCKSEMSHPGEISPACDFERLKHARTPKGNVLYCVFETKLVRTLLYAMCQVHR